MLSGGTKMYLTWNQLPKPTLPGSPPLPTGLSCTEECLTAAGQRKHSEGVSQMQKRWLLLPLDPQPGSSKLSCLPWGVGMCSRGWALPLPILCLRRSRTHVASRIGIYVPMGKSNSSEMRDLCAAAVQWMAPLVKMPGTNDGHHKILPSAAREVWLCV